MSCLFTCQASDPAFPQLLIKGDMLTPTPAPLDATPVYIGTELPDAASCSPWAHLSLLQHVP
jgi:hypothetical protein